jgi:hypothetical protein
VKPHLGQLIKNLRASGLLCVDKSHKQEDNRHTKREQPPMTKMTNFLVLAPSVAAPDKTIIVSRHATRESAERAVRLAKGAPDYRVQSLLDFFQ